ncbi:VOC family protein [Microbacterium sp. GXF7504]
MPRIFVNLPTGDVERAKAFYTALGARAEPNFTDANAACMLWDDDSLALMLMDRAFFATFTDKRIVDPAEAVQTVVSFVRDTRAEVDDLVERAIAAGGREAHPPEDQTFMYSRDVEDPDGNALGFLYLVPEATA